MKIKTEQLARTLKANAHPVYWLSGDEPLLLQEAADQVRRYHRDVGFADREIHTIRGFRATQRRECRAHSKAKGMTIVLNWEMRGAPC